MKGTLLRTSSLLLVTILGWGCAQDTSSDDAGLPDRNPITASDGGSSGAGGSEGPGGTGGKADAGTSSGGTKANDPSAGTGGSEDTPSGGEGGTDDGGAGGSDDDASAGSGGDPTAGTGGSTDEPPAGFGGSDDGGQGGSDTGGGTGGAEPAGAGGTAGKGGSTASGGAGGSSSGAGGTGASSGGAGGSTGGSGTAGSGDVTVPTGVPFILLGAITGASDEEEAMIVEGVALANTTMATECFKNQVLSASWTETNGLTQEQIWDKLCSGPVAVDVDMYTGSWYQNHVTHTIGYEDEPGVVHMNRYFVDTAYMVADNVVHEAEGHSQGFSHYQVKATSVPYGLNGAFEACSPVDP